MIRRLWDFLFRISPRTPRSSKINDIVRCIVKLSMYLNIVAKRKSICFHLFPNICMVCGTKIYHQILLYEYWLSFVSHTFHIKPYILTNRVEYDILSLRGCLQINSRILLQEILYFLNQSPWKFSCFMLTAFDCFKTFVWLNKIFSRIESIFQLFKKDI